MNERGQIIRTIAAVRPKMKIRTRVTDDEFGSEVLPQLVPSARQITPFRHQVAA